ncbi:MAG: tetratricopeptide repeat protein [Sphingomonas sp.]|nr:MAG: tetratricopeptide repeat protein [Sphingomonas sp.]
MRDADQLLKSGDLDGARRALVEVVRTSPGDASARMFLFQLLALGGEWDKARIQLDALAKISPEAQMLSVVYGQAIAAERERAEVIGGRSLAMQHVPSEWAEGVVEALQHFGQGRIAEGQAAREAAFDAAPDTVGRLNDVAFDWISDADSRFGPAFEVIIGGRYGLQAFDGVEKIVSEGPQDLRDLIWYPVQITFRTGQSVAALLPARYPGTESLGDADEKLARSTSWRQGASGPVGSGQRLFSLSSGDEQNLLSVRSLVFA